MTKHDRYQTDTKITTPGLILQGRAFQAGFADARAGRRPRFDAFSDSWGYERGRAFAVIAPPRLKLFSKNGWPNPRAIRELDRFLRDGGL